MEVLGDVKGEVVAGGVVHREHLKGSSGGTMVAETVGVDAVAAGIFGENIAKSVGIAVEIGDNGGGLAVGAEVFVKGGLLLGVVNGANSAVAESGDPDKTEAKAREV